MGSGKQSLLYDLVEKHPHAIEWSKPSFVKVYWTKERKLGFCFKTILNDSQSITLITDVKEYCRFSSSNLLKPFNRIVAINNQDITKLTESEVWQLLVASTKGSVDLETCCPIELKKLSATETQHDFFVGSDFTKVKRALSTSSSLVSFPMENPCSCRQKDHAKKRANREMQHKEDTMQNKFPEILMNINNNNNNISSSNSMENRTHSLPLEVCNVCNFSGMEGDQVNSLPLHSSDGNFCVKDKHCGNRVCRKLHYPHLVLKNPTKAVWDPLTKTVTLKRIENGSFGFTYKMKVGKNKDGSLELYTLVEFVQADSPAYGKLFLADWIRSVDGTILQIPAQPSCCQDGNQARSPNQVKPNVDPEISNSIKMAFDKSTSIRLVIQRPTSILPDSPTAMIVSPPQTSKFHCQPSFEKDIKPFWHLENNLPVQSCCNCSYYAHKQYSPTVRVNSPPTQPVCSCRVQHSPVSLQTKQKCLCHCCSPGNDSLHSGNKNYSCYQLRSSCSPTTHGKFQSLDQQQILKERTSFSSCRVFLCGRHAASVYRCLVSDSYLQNDIENAKYATACIKIDRNGDPQISKWNNRWKLDGVSETIKNMIPHGQFRGKSDYVHLLNSRDRSPVIELMCVPDDNFFHLCAHLAFVEFSSIFIITFDCKEFLENTKAEVDRLAKLLHTIRVHGTGFSSTVYMYCVMKSNFSCDGDLKERLVQLFHSEHVSPLLHLKMPPVIKIDMTDKEGMVKKILSCLFKTFKKNDNKIFLLEGTRIVLGYLRQKSIKVTCWNDLYRTIHDILPGNPDHLTEVIISDMIAIGELVEDFSPFAPPYIPADNNPALVSIGFLLETMATLLSPPLEFLKTLENKQAWVKLASTGIISRPSLYSLYSFLQQGSESLFKLMEIRGLLFCLDNPRSDGNDRFFLPFVKHGLALELKDYNKKAGNLYIHFNKRIPHSTFLHLMLNIGRRLGWENIAFGTTECKILFAKLEFTFHYVQTSDLIVISASNRMCEMEKLSQFAYWLSEDCLKMLPQPFVFGPACPRTDCQTQRQTGIHVIDCFQSLTVTCDGEILNQDEMIKIWLTSPRTIPGAQSFDMVLGSDCSSGESVTALPPQIDVPRSPDEIYCTELPYSVLHKLYGKLNVSHPRGYNWMAIAEYLEVAAGLVPVYEAVDNPAKELLMDWFHQCTPTVSEILDIFKRIQRNDLISLIENWLPNVMQKKSSAGCQ